MYKQVTCVNTSDPQRHENISVLGGDWGREARTTVISNIDAGRDVYYTADASNNVALVEVVRESGKDPYVRTKADGKFTNNLLSLNACSLY